MGAVEGAYYETSEPQGELNALQIVHKQRSTNIKVTSSFNAHIFRFSPTKTKQSNIAGTLPKKSRNSFVDLHFSKTRESNRRKKDGEILSFDSESVQLIAASISCSQIAFN